MCKTRYTMYKCLWYQYLKPFFYPIKVIDIGVFCDCNDKCHLQSREPLAIICQRWLFAPSERVFLFFLAFLRTSQDNDDFVVFNPPMLPTSLMIRLSEFIYETLFLKLLQTTNGSKKIVNNRWRILPKLHARLCLFYWV